MNIAKNQWIIIAIVGAIAIWYFFLRKKDETKESGYVRKLGPKSNTGTSGTTGGYNTIAGGKTSCDCFTGYKYTTDADGNSSWLKDDWGDFVRCACGGAKVVSGNLS